MQRWQLTMKEKKKNIYLRNILVVPDFACLDGWMETMKDVKYEGWHKWRLAIMMATMKDGSHEGLKSWSMATIKDGNHEGWPPWRMETMKDGNHEGWPPWKMANAKDGNHEGWQPWRMATMKKYRCNPGSAYLFNPTTQRFVLNDRWQVNTRN